MAKKERNYRAGEVLFREGDPGGDIFIIKSGEVKVFQERAGQEVQLAQLGKGELLGAMTATTKTSRTASVKAMNDVAVTIIDNSDVEKLLKDMPPWAKILLKDLVFRLKFMNELYVQSLSHDVAIKDQNELLRSAIRLAKGILANGKVQKRKVEGTVVVDLSSAFSPLLDIFLSEKGTFLRIYNLFLESNLLELMRLRIPGKFLSQDELNGLQIFYDMANAHLAFAYQNRSIESLAQSERKILFEAAVWAKGLIT
ncbi:MAG: cyclic nucleotide-binding domain-containing protein, partial [Proteobacteria bacterium]